MGSRKNDTGDDNCRPDQEPEPTEERPNERQPRFEKAIGIEQRNAYGQWIHQALLPLLTLLALIAVEKLLGVRWHVALEHVGGVQLTHQLYGLVLSRSIVAETRGCCIPCVLNALRTIEAGDEMVRCRCEAVVASRRTIFENIPELPAIVMAAKLRVAANSRC